MDKTDFIRLLAQRLTDIGYISYVDGGVKVRVAGTFKDGIEYRPGAEFFLKIFKGVELADGEYVISPVMAGEQAIQPDYIPTYCSQESAFTQHKQSTPND